MVEEDAEYCPDRRDRASEIRRPLAGEEDLWHLKFNSGILA